MSDQCRNNSWGVPRNCLLPRQTIKIETFFHCGDLSSNNITQNQPKKTHANLRQILRFNCGSKFCPYQTANCHHNRIFPSCEVTQTGVGCGAVWQACTLHDGLTAPTATLHFNIMLWRTQDTKHLEVLQRLTDCHTCATQLPYTSCVTASQLCFRLRTWDTKEGHYLQTHNTRKSKILAIYASFKTVLIL